MECCAVLFNININGWLIVGDYFLSAVCSMRSVYCYLSSDHIAAVIPYALVMFTELLIYVLYF